MNISRKSSKIAAGGLSALALVGVTAYAASAAGGSSPKPKPKPKPAPTKKAPPSLCAGLPKAVAHQVCSELERLAGGKSLAGEHLVWLRTTFGATERFDESVSQLLYVSDHYGAATELAFGPHQKLHASDIPANRPELLVEVWGPVTVGQVYIPVTSNGHEPVTAGHVASLTVDPVTGAIPLYGIAQPLGHTGTAAPYRLPA